MIGLYFVDSIIKIYIFVKKHYKCKFGIFTNEMR